ncbi:small ribosomal subunit protein mS45 [Trichomonascus vanleenenianus]|uniref:mitochondrial 37S ribosomal protein mS45 MRPS35 n=1 Tax=Trichomonascus vanleenenianus TaxID=2268995 RepID=UPI003ECA641B
MFAQRVGGAPTLIRQQVRNASTLGKRKKRITSYRTEMRRFLGPKNFKGMYTKNPFFFAAKNNEPTYMTSFSTRGATREGGKVDWTRVFAKDPRRTIQPFQENNFCKSNHLISDALRKTILSEYSSGKMTVQRLGFKYGISIPRIEAIIALDKIESSMKQSGKISSEMGKYARTMEGMFPLLEPNSRLRDDLTEIPIPDETRHQRFISIAESQPFGPVDAANVLNIEPAAETLEKLNNHELELQSKSKKREVSFIAAQLEGEKAAFRFTNAKVGEVGHRYGAARDDRKHGRKMKYTATGQAVWA